ncbi:putative membrane protein [Desulfobotulus alkaliphilus]|uniref:Putative membrane protein n=1 Tax=Desulfobotulus alkaliphilus TaxID=622671 RepID=A0A562S0C8_9BACT|nr:YibE/F family protein [Desulfobotulus alkaliphilus]TWI73986.1 putative membrane protein [Desulfobotulus alkaliphilus]
MHKSKTRSEILLVSFFFLLTLLLFLLPTGFEERKDPTSLRCRGEVVEVDNAFLRQYGMVRTGSQNLVLRIVSGDMKGERVHSANHLLGKLDLDRLYQAGDRVLLVLTLDGDRIRHAQVMDHYRLDMQAWLAGSFAFLLVAFAGWTGMRALLSFVFTGLMVWKILIPGFLKGWDPMITALFVVMLLSAAILFLVAGWNRKGFTAFAGCLLGLFCTALLALFVAPAFQLHGAIKPFSETLMYTGYAHLDLTRIFLATIIMAASGAVMDLAMDIAASMDEVVSQNPRISRSEAMFSGFRVGRAVMGTMSTTLLLAYSSSYLSLLMVFMAQGIPMANMLNLNYVTAEFLNTILGSFGLLAVAPFTALAGAFFLVPGDRSLTRKIRREEQDKPKENLTTLTQP